MFLGRAEKLSPFLAVSWGAGYTPNMSHESTILLIGILITLSPFLGLPYSWLMVVVPILGIMTAVLSIIIRARSMREPQAQEATVPVSDPVFDESSSVTA